MTFIELAKSKLGFVWDGQLALFCDSKSGIISANMIYPIKNKANTPGGHLKDMVREMLEDPDCYEAARTWWAELNGELK